jgi:itaconyl-CoA hydratase
MTPPDPNSQSERPAPTTEWRGRFYEDFEVDAVYRHALGRTVLDTDNSWFTLLTMNTNELHFNHHYAESQPFGKPLANSTMTLAMVIGLTVYDVSQNAVANLGMDEVRLTAPVFCGDTLYAESVVLDKRTTESRPYAGIVKVLTRGLNQDGTEIMSFTRTIMVLKADSDQAKQVFPEPETDIRDR